MDYKVVHEIKTNGFIEWWKEKQNFQQIKPMHEAHSRIANSQIDIDLFMNQLAWGVNLDGFTLDLESQKVSAIFEKEFVLTNLQIIRLKIMILTVFSLQRGRLSIMEHIVPIIKKLTSSSLFIYF